MRIGVCLTYVPDPDSVEVDPLTGEIDAVRTLHIMNPADATALELALRLRDSQDDGAHGARSDGDGDGDGERAGGGRVTAFTVGPVEADAVLREALAVGSDEVLRLWDDTRSHTRPAVTSLLLAAGLRLAGPPDLVLCGARTVDRGSGKVPGLLGEYLECPAVTDVTAFEIRDGRAHYQCRLARGARSEGVVTLPAVLGVEAGSTRLRYASLPGLMQAKRASVPVRHLSDLGLSPQDLNFPTATLSAPMPPRPRPRAIFIPDSTLSPEERAAQIMSAGVTQKTASILHGPPEDMADAIIAFLKERGFLEGAP